MSVSFDYPKYLFDYRLASQYFESEMKELIIPMIMQYLKDNGYIQSYLHLQSQSKMNLKDYPKEIQFFQKILLRGDFNEAVKFIWNFQTKIQRQILNNFTQLIYKQKLYQLLENPNEQALKDLFEREIVEYCSEEQYQHLFTLLTYRSIKQIGGMEEWTIIKGRYNCFEQISPLIEGAFTLQIKKQRNNRKQLAFTLEQIVKEVIDHSQSIKSKKSPTAYAFQGRKNHHDKKPKQQLYWPMESDISHSLADVNSPQSKIQQPSFFQKSITSIPSSISIKPKEKGHRDHHQQFSRKGNHEQFWKKGNLKGSPNPKQYERQFIESQIIKEEEHRNTYLDQNNESQIYQSSSRDHEQFTFSNGGDEEMNHYFPKKITRLTNIRDNKAIRTCQFSLSGRYLALGTNSSSLKIYNIEQILMKNVYQQIVLEYQISQLHSKSIFSLDWSTSQKYIATCSNDLTVKLTQLRSNGDKLHSHATNVIGKHESCIRMVKLRLNSGQSKIVSCADDCLIKIWDLQKIKNSIILRGHKQGVSAFKLGESQGTNILYSVGKDCIIRKWDCRAGICVNTSPPQVSQITFIANNTEKIVISHKNGLVSFFDKSLQLENSAKIHEQQIRSIQGNNENLFITSSFDGHIGIFSQRTIQSPYYHQHNQAQEDKVVYATFMAHSDNKGFASTSTSGFCSVFSYQ